MTQRRTIDLLPEIFKTQTNKQVLAATLDQLIQEPNVKKTQGFVGRRVGPGVNPADNYVVEPTADRSNYQLEPGVVFLKPDTSFVQDAITYPGMLDALNIQGAGTEKADRLFESEYYSWDPFCDLDKFTNYSQYYWLPDGPESVNVRSIAASLTNAFDINRNAITGYDINGFPGSNPPLVLVRGGNYTFDVDQLGHNFWIQLAPGVDGRLPATPNISSRDVLGVFNNGTDRGTVTFNVPTATAQEFYYTMPSAGTVDLITDLKFSDINNVYVDTFLANNPSGIDGITDLNGRTVFFINRTQDAVDGGWVITTQFDPLARVSTNNGLPGSFDSLPFDLTTPILELNQRYSVWQIRYQLDNDGQAYIQLVLPRQIPETSKLDVLFGTQWSGTQWFRNNSGFPEQVPLLTATSNRLYYQDSTDPALFGEIRLIEPGDANPLVIDDIVGASSYTSPNGVKFTNGLKVKFTGDVEPVSFANREFYVEGVGTPELVAGVRPTPVGFVNGEAYYGPSHEHLGRKMTGASHVDTLHQFIYETVAESIENIGQAGPTNAPLPNVSTPGALNGNGIKLIPVESLSTPEVYISIQNQFSDSIGDLPTVPDYITINRSSQDLNAWTRSNRWFHIDVLQYAAEINKRPLVINNDQRARRPIIEFRSNLNLFNFGTLSKGFVDIIDFQETDALSNINGQLGYAVDGVQFRDGTRVIFAADSDNDVRNQIYEVRFVDPNGDGEAFVIDLVPAVNGVALINETVTCTSGNIFRGLEFWFDGITWVVGPQKTGVNQAPLFDIRDSQGRSFADQVAYPSSSFMGSRLFGYAAANTSINDVVLGFPLAYYNINNVGDIVFENYFYTDTFDYVENRQGVVKNISEGFVREYLDRVQYSNGIGWVPAATESRQRQVFRFTFDGTQLIFDVPADLTYRLTPLQIFVNSVYVDSGQYTVSVVGQNTFVTFTNPPAVGTIIEAQIISNAVSSVGFYQVPDNLENNSLNKNSTRFTLGTIRAHYESIGQNIRNLQGPIVGANNTRDLGNILKYGINIVQQSAPLVTAGVFLRDQQYDIFTALSYNSTEYQKYKARLIDLAGKGDFINNTATEILDQVMLELSLGRTELSPFFWSDMVPAGENYTQTVYTVTPITTPFFDTLQTYNFSEANYRGILVYLNGTIAVKDLDYTIENDAPVVTVLTPLNIGDQVVIREYSGTFGTYVPNTPSKMGMYPAWRPAKFLDTTYVNPQTVIQGHDGSITVAYGDIRDDILLEFETRIYNNIKIDTAVPLMANEVVPSQFRPTEFSLQEINEILGTEFLAWVGANKLDYTSQTYLANNQFTWNYSQSSERLTGQPLLGNWHGIYQYFYGTQYPASRPWEMLGFTIQPTWWEDSYGPAPYTSGNLVLWKDLEDGYVRDPSGAYVLPKYARPNLTQVIPVDSEGRQLSPLQAVVKNYDANSFRRSWTVGDVGPTEYAWRSSSAWPFAVMKLLAVTKPAKFFSLFVDRDRYKFDAGLDQYVWDGRYRLEAQNLEPLYGNGVSKASYINWIVDYNQQKGNNSTTSLTTRLANVDVRLTWRMAGFSDKKYLKLISERSTPNSLNTSLLLPDESYQLLLYKNQAVEQVFYSSVIVQSTDLGWAVYGYNPTKPYFEILISRVQGGTREIVVGSERVRVATSYSNNVTRVPYGYVFTSKAAVCDFLLSYGETLTRQGFVFTTQENGYIVDWNQMAVEFLYWNSQGWITGSLINLNPGATRIRLTRPGLVAESIQPATIENAVLNQNRQTIPPTDLQINRSDNTFEIVSLTQNTLNFLTLRFTAYEHMAVLDNTSIFADLIYDSVTGSRQSRILVNGMLSADWNGTVNAPGFILNQDNVPDWNSNQKYTKGEIVIFKDEYWTASTIIEPSQEFDYNLWLRSDYDQIQQGLLPNAANASDQLADAYSTYSASIEQETDLFSFGLIGFRPRPYMQALNLSDISQVNLYQQFLGNKGTLRSAEVFSLTDLGKEVAEYNIYENWAILKSTYGANANRNYFELVLDESQLASDPALIQVINPGETSEANQTVFVDNIWKSSYRITEPNILPTVTDIEVNPNTLPSAGYVNLDDVDVSLFSLDNFSLLSPLVNQLGVGATVWVGKTNSYDWGVFRVDAVPGDITQVSNNLEGLALVNFSKAHNLSNGDYLIIKYFDARINGIYRVRSVSSITSVLIEYVFSGAQNVIIGTGVALTLKSARVRQASDISALPYSRDLIPGARAWVDNAGDGKWEVLEKNDVYSVRLPLLADTPVENAKFGSAVSQGFNNLTALVGAPGAASNSGLVYIYAKTELDEYKQTGVLELTSIGTESFGATIDIGDSEWAVIGAPESDDGYGYALVVNKTPAEDVFRDRQLLIPKNLYDANTSGQFGSSVTVSNDERWLYVGAPEANKVFAYARVDVQLQSVQYITDGVTAAYNYSDKIFVTDPTTQLAVVLANRLLTYGTEYEVNASEVVLNQVPRSDRPLIITRINSKALDQSLYSDLTQSSTSGAGVAVEITVFDVRGDYNVTLQEGGSGYIVGDTVTFAGTLFDGTSPANDLVLTITGTTEFGSVTTFTTSGQGVTNQATFEITDVIATATNIYSFTVKVNNTIYRPFVDYTFDNNVGELTFVTSPPPGATISVTSDSYFEHIDTLEIPAVETLYQSHSGNVITVVSTSGIVPGMRVINSGIAANQYVTQILSSTQVQVADIINGSPSGNIRFELYQFGHSVSTTSDARQVIVGAPGLNSPGQTFVFNRSVERFQIANPSANTFTTVQTIVSPVAVLLDGTFLRNRALYNNGNFTVNSTNSITITETLPLGGIVEIETNRFVLLQQLGSDNPSRPARFGAVVDQCINNCSLYISAPKDSTVVPEGGQVEFLQNQARVYGVIETTVANPVLVSGQYLRIDNYMVQCTGTTVNDLVADINRAQIPNVVATMLPDVAFVAAPGVRTYSVGSIYSAAASYTAVVFLNGTLLDSSAYTYNNITQQITLTTTPVAGDVYTVKSGRFRIEVKNQATSQPLNRVQVLPGTGTVFNTLGFAVYVWQQTVRSPVPQDYAQFGGKIFISDNTITLVVSAPNGSMILPTTFDSNTTTFDSNSTQFADARVNSGAVYVFDYLPSVNQSVTNPAQWAFGQQITDSAIKSLDQFGAAIDLTTGTLLIGAPGNDLGDSQLNYGQVREWKNPTQSLAWRVIRKQEPVVDINLLNTVYTYDRVTNTPSQYYDFFDPLQGRLLGVVEQNLNYIGAVDPAAYNRGAINNQGQRWVEEYVGQMWWDTTRARFIDPNQNDSIYASQRWGQLFPGSQVDVYQWVSSSVPPAQYAGDGTPRNTTSFVVNNSVTAQGFVEQTYYFWVRNPVTILNAARKTLSANTIARYIENPRGSGIAYIAPINSSTIAIYNGLSDIVAQDTVLHVEFDRTFNDDPVYLEYQLIPERADGFLSDQLYSKLIDSFSGVNASGAPVPDPFLSPSEQYGIEVRPRQSMFVNRFLALKNYLSRSNQILSQFPISEIRRSPLLFAAEPEPTVSSNEWNLRVLDLDELSYQNVNLVPVGYKYLVASDSGNSGRWTIYQVIQVDRIGNQALSLTRVQNYDTREYWKRIDWYSPAYDPFTRIVTEVRDYSALATLTLPVGSSVKVTANAQGLWEIYQNVGPQQWNRVALQQGTIQFSELLWNYSAGRFGFDVEVFDSQQFDQEPVIETRFVIQAINQELLVDDLLVERNRLLTLMFNFILTEQQAPSWLTKTSLIDVDHTIRELKPFQIYRRDNQDFVLNYIQEVKPYHVQIREFNLIYRGQDVYQGTLADFDLPAQWDPAQSLFISPVLDNNRTLSTTSSVPSTANVWKTFPYNQWFNNYLLNIDSITIVNGGTGYTVAPQVVVTGTSTAPAEMRARINSAGQVIAIDIIAGGTGYSTTATIELTGGNGTGAKAVAVMGNDVVRAIGTTIKYDRYQYTSSITDWEPNVIYINGTQVRYNNRVWQAANILGPSVTGSEFDLENWQLIPADALSGVDRVRGYYVPSPIEPGLDLAQLMTGISYPGVQVKAPNFSQNTGFDVGNFDINPFDNISFGPEGRPTYDPAILDAIYESRFTDVFLGTRPTDINVDGGLFVDTYESHAPEELVPGITYDTLDMRVFTTPGADWIGRGHSWQQNSINAEFVPNIPVEVLFPLINQSLVVTNVTTQKRLFIVDDFVVDFGTNTVVFLPTAAAPGDTIQVVVLGIGTSNVLYTDSFVYPGGFVPIPAPPELLDQVIRLFTLFGTTVISIADLVTYPVAVQLWNQTINSVMTPGIDYAVDWENYNVIVFASNTNFGDVIQVVAYGIGGGNQLYTNSYVNPGTSVVIPMQSSLIEEVAIFVNGVPFSAYTVTQETPSTSRITFAVPFNFNTRVTLAAMGVTPRGTVLEWSTPVTQVTISNGSNTVLLTNSMQGTNPIDAIVSVNGRRATPPNSAPYITAPDRLIYDVPLVSTVLPDGVADSEVVVYLDNVLLTQGVDYVVLPWDGSSLTRSIQLTNNPPVRDYTFYLIVACTTTAQYNIVGQQLNFIPGSGLAPVINDTITVTSFNDTSEQLLLTQVFVGPDTSGELTVSEGYDTDLFDVGNINNAPGSFDYSEGLIIRINQFDTGRTSLDAARLVVTLDGRYLFQDQNWYQNSETSIIIKGATINPNQVVTIFQSNAFSVPDATGFRIFQDMRGLQRSYRISPGATTQLITALGATSDTITVADASVLTVPNLALAIFGQITINGERIAYRNINLATNTISGLRRGVAGTAASTHPAGSAVYVIGAEVELPMQYQDTLVYDNFLADGATSTFVATDVQIIDDSSAVEAVEVYVGGLLQTTGYSITSTAPVTVVFDTPPAAGYQVSIRVLQGLSWYQPGFDSASDGTPLQETNTDAARFIRNDI